MFLKTKSVKDSNTTNNWNIGTVFKAGKIFRKAYFKKALALITILAVIITAYWQNTPNALLEVSS